MYNNIAAERARRNLTQDELAEAINVEKQSIGIWEKDPKKMPINIAEHLADYFDCTVDYIIGKTDERLGTRTFLSSVFVDKQDGDMDCGSGPQ